MYTIFSMGSGAPCAHMRQQLLPAKTRAKNLEEFPFGLIADRAVAAAHTNV